MENAVNESAGCVSLPSPYPLVLTHDTDYSSQRGSVAHFLLTHPLTHTHKYARPFVAHLSALFPQYPVRPTNYNRPSHLASLLLSVPSPVSASLPPPRYPFRVSLRGTLPPSLPPTATSRVRVSQLHVGLERAAKVSGFPAFTKAGGSGPKGRGKMDDQAASRRVQGVSACTHHRRVPATSADRRPKRCLFSNQSQFRPAPAHLRTSSNLSLSAEPGGTGTPLSLNDSDADCFLLVNLRLWRAPPLLR